jgi:hypothetical protein
VLFGGEREFVRKKVEEEGRYVALWKNWRTLPEKELLLKVGWNEAERERSKGKVTGTVVRMKLTLG